MRERTLQRYLKCVEVAVRVVVLDAELAELRQRTLPRGRVDQICGAGLEQVMSFAAGVGDSGQEAARQLLLDVKVPVFVVQIVAQPVDALGAEAQRLKLTDKGIDRE